MTPPRHVVPGATYLVTRRCSERRFFLLPEEVVTQVVLFCLAVAASACGIEVHGYVCMGNHYHILLTDPLAKLPEFLEWMNGHIAKCLNVHWQRSQNLFDCRQTSCVRLVEAPDVLEKLLYTLLNPVAAGLVRRAEQWPGAWSSPEDYGRVQEFERPELYFDENGDVPRSARLRLVQPRGYQGMSRRQFVAMLRRRLREKEQGIQQRFRENGRRFLGVRAVLARSPFDSPATPSKRGALSPRIACKNEDRRKQALLELVAFWRDYHQALERFVAGFRSTVFPGGTYLMRVRFRIRCRPPPDYWVRPAGG